MFICSGRVKPLSAQPENVPGKHGRRLLSIPGIFTAFGMQGVSGLQCTEGRTLFPDYRMSTANFSADFSVPVQVTLIVPVYNEAGNLPPLMEEIAAAMNGQPRPWEALFIDDGSTDGSLAVLRSLAEQDPRVHYLSFAANRGQSAAFAAGFREASGDILVTLDADLQNDPADIPPMLDLYESGYDMVIGWRAERRDTWRKRLASKIANSVRNALSNECVRDTGCSLKVLRASLARELPLFTGMHRFFPTLMKMRGATVAEIKVGHRPRRYGVSKYGIWDRAFSSFADLLAVRWMQRRSFHYDIRERR